jgi:hypothetical protein
MIGRREGRQGQFFYSFNLDQVVPADHLVRQIDGVLDLAWVRQELAPYYSHTGRPSIDPVLSAVCPQIQALALSKGHIARLWRQRAFLKSVKSAAIC